MTRWKTISFLSLVTVKAMKRPPGKIKDFVELLAFDDVRDFFADPARALAAYRFTDATSDLLARWLDALADLPHGQGTALALAGLRGFGKSHMLAVFSALLSIPHLRSSVADAHVAASASRLSDRRFVVVHVKRGILPTLTDELIAGLSAGFGGGHQVQWGADPTTILEVANLHAQAATLVIIVDTAFGRAARVSRDDGPLLSQLAKAVVHANAMVALALDDDISGADGVNVALASTFQIDYLDPEHIYRVADLYLLRKTAQARDFLHDVYARLRSVVPGFNWSQQRFTSTYPVHPIIADLAAAVRLYAPTFAFLPFAASAAGQALARPALSLVVLDEVFDRIEEDLRATEEVKEALAAYDYLGRETIAQLPVMRRLQAKLTLKGLFVLSLDGRGATARELCAAMLFYDEGGTEASINHVEEILQRFAEAAPPNSLEKSLYGDCLRYCFNVTGSAGFDAALAKRVAALENCEAEIDHLLQVHARARFPDWPLADENGKTCAESDFSLLWRGADRPGRLLWQNRANDQYSTDDGAALKDKLFYDWKIAVLPPGLPVAEEVVRAGFDVWAPAPPTAEETDILRRLVALRADDALFTQYEETARAAETMLEARAELIWTRLFVDEGVLIIDGVRQQLSSAARGAPTLGEALAQMFTTRLDDYYPAHPIFAARLEEDEVTNLIGGLFVGAYVTDPTTQRLAGLFAAPLGLTTELNGVLTPDVGGSMLAQAWVREILELINAAGGEVVALDEIYRQLRNRPYGLLREPQQLLLAALVAQRRLEFVLASGERLGRRALEGPLRWDEMTGVAASASLLQGAEELTAWAARLTDQSDLPLLSDDESRVTIGAALAEWLERWRDAALLQRFEQLPDEALTIRSSHLAADVKRSFGMAAQAVEAALAGHIPLEEGLHRVSDSFGGSEEDFAQALKQTGTLTEYLAELEQRMGTRDYILLAESTGIDEIENIRRELLALTDDVHSLFDSELRRHHRLLWQKFHARYTEHFARAHDETMCGDEIQRRVDELVNSAEWREFEMLSLGISLVNKQYWRDAETLQRRAQEVRCDLPVRTLLIKRPFCQCHFRLARVAELTSIPEDLRYTVERGRAAHRRTLEMWSRHLSRALGELAAAGGRGRDAADAVTAGNLIALFGTGTLPLSFSHKELRLIEQALQNTVLPPVRVEWPAGSYGLLTRQELHERLAQWVEEMPEHPALIEVVTESDGGGDAKI